MGSRPAKRATYGRLAQLVRASVLHTGGQRFKSSTAHHKGDDITHYWLLVFLLILQQVIFTFASWVFWRLTLTGNGKLLGVKLAQLLAKISGILNYTRT